MIAAPEKSKVSDTLVAMFFRVKPNSDFLVSKEGIISDRVQTVATRQELNHFF